MTVVPNKAMEVASIHRASDQFKGNYENNDQDQA
jgi:hypothetical protein